MGRIDFEHFDRDPPYHRRMLDLMNGVAPLEESKSNVAVFDIPKSPAFVKDDAESCGETEKDFSDPTEFGYEIDEK